MGYTCRVCGQNEVDMPGGICEMCAINADPYASALGGYQTTPSGYGASSSSATTATYTPSRSSSKRPRVLLGGGSAIQNVDPYGNDMTPTSNPQVQVYSPGHMPATATTTAQANPTITGTSGTSAAQGAKVSSNQPLTSGISKNIVVDNQKKSILAKWFRALFGGVPFTLEDDITMFQVYPDYSGTALNSMGNACDQVIVYGKLNNGAVSENNDVEVYGKRDSSNNIVAKTILNKASGTTIVPQHTLAPAAVWAITGIVIALVCAVLFSLGVEGVVWVLIILLCLTNLPLVIKIIGAIFGVFFSILRSIFRG